MVALNVPWGKPVPEASAQISNGRTRLNMVPLEPGRATLTEGQKRGPQPFGDQGSQRSFQSKCSLSWIVNHEWDGGQQRAKVKTV